MSRLRYFDWYSVPNLSDLLIDSRMVALKHWICEKRREELRSSLPSHCEGTVDLLRQPNYRKFFYQYTDEWMDNFLQEEPYKQVELVMRTSWGKLSPIRNPEDILNVQEIQEIQDDYDRWTTTIHDEFDNPRVIEHYIYIHRCYILALFIFFLCKLIFPKKDFIICDTGSHAFVKDKSDPNTIYDIFWWYFNEPLYDIDKYREYTDPKEFVDHVVVYDDPTTWDDELRLEDFMKIERLFV